MTSRLAFAMLALAAGLHAHIGSPDVFFEGSAGPYRLFVTIRPPQVFRALRKSRFAVRRLECARSISSRYA